MDYTGYPEFKDGNSNGIQECSNPKKYMSLTQHGIQSFNFNGGSEEPDKQNLGNPATWEVAATHPCWWLYGVMLPNLLGIIILPII